MTADTHEAAVARLRETYAALPPGTPVRLAKRTSNLFRFRDSVPKAPAGAAAAGGLDVSAFGHVLGIDPAARTARVGGMTTYEDLCDATLRHRLMPLVVPQLKTITLGGAVTGLGIESTSLRNGMPHESVIEMEILTGDGRVVRATADNEHARLVPRVPELLRHSRLRPVAHHRARARAAVRAPAPLPVRDAGRLHGRDRPDRRGGQLPRPPGGLRRRDRVLARTSCT